MMAREGHFLAPRPRHPAQSRASALHDDRSLETHVGRMGAQALIAVA